MNRQSKEALEVCKLSFGFCLAVFIFFGCGSSDDGKDGSNGRDGVGCFIRQTGKVSEIICDGSTTTIVINDEVVPVKRRKNREVAHVR